MQYGSISDIGNVRLHNDDCSSAVMNNDQQLLLIVCDGLGGYKGGETASHIVLNNIVNQFQNTNFIGYDKNQIRKWFINVITSAQKEIDACVLLEKESYNMGTTLVASIIINDKVYTINIGDSRAFLLKENCSLKITKDHNLFEALKERNEPDSLFEKYSSQLAALTQFIGRTSNVLITYDIFENTLENGDIILLSSDGFYNFIDINDIYSKLTHKNFNTELTKLISLALENGSNDNLSLAVYQHIG